MLAKSPSEVTWYISRDQKAHGPVNWEQLNGLAREGKLRPDDLLCLAGTDRWFPAKTMAALFEVLPSLAPEVVPAALPDTLEPVGTANGRPDPTAGAAPPSPTGPLLPTLPGLELLKELGRGGMGVVYLARHTRLNRLVAVKMIRDDSRPSPDQLSRFESEARALARLQHPNIVQIYDVGEHRGQPYYTMEFVEGGSLKGSVSGTPWDPAAAARLIETLARAMHVAHCRGIVHRDLKPGNVLLAAADGAASTVKDGVASAAPRTSTGPAPGLVAKVTDFGLAKDIDESTGPTREGALLGTPAYMAPEQAAGQIGRIGPHTDVYALGVMLYEMVCGRLPFVGNAQVVLYRILEEQPPPPRKLNPVVPRDLETVCLKCLEKDPGRRYLSALELAEELRRFQNREPVQARLPGLSERLLLWARRRPALATAYALLFLLVLVGGQLAFVISQRRAAEKARDQAQQARQDAEQLKEQLALSDYLHRVELAQRDFDARDLRRAMQLLNECPRELRGWEWEYVHALCSRQMKTVRHQIPGMGHALSPDGARLAMTTGEKVWVTDALTGKQQFESNLPPPPPPAAGVFGGLGALGGGGPLPLMSFSPSGDSLRCLHGGQLMVFNREGKQTSASKVFPAATATAVSPDARLLADVTLDKVVVWDVAAGKEKISLSQDDTGRVTRLAFSPKFNLLATAGPRSELRVWEVGDERKQRLRTLAPPDLVGVDEDENTFEPTVLVFGPDAGWLAVGGKDGEVCAWDGKSDVPRLHDQGPRGRVTCLAFSPDGRLLASGGEDGSVQVWDLSLGSQLSSYPGHERGVSAVAFAADGKSLSSLGEEDEQLKVWDVRPLRGEALFRLELEAHELTHGRAFDPGGKRVAGNIGNRIVVMDLDTGRSWKGKEVGIDLSHSLNIAIGPDASLVAVDTVGADDGSVLVWREGTNEAPRLLKGVHTPRCLAISGDGKWLAAEGAGPSVKVWDTGTWQVVATLTGHTGQIHTLDFSKDGRLLASAGSDCTARVWDFQAGKAVCVCKDPGADGKPPVLGPLGPEVDPREALCLAFTPDGARLATGCYDGSLRLWDAATGKEVVALGGHSGPIREVAFHPGGRLLASASDDGTIKVWHTDLARCGLTLRESLLNTVAPTIRFSPDGGRLFSSVGNAGTVRVRAGFPLATGQRQ